MKRKTEQESFWEGSFGDAYIDRNPDARGLAGSIALFARILARTPEVGSVLELGANIGINLKALHALLPGASLSAVEINAKAVSVLRQQPYVDVRHQSILEFIPDRQWDLVFTAGVLIHLNPEALPAVYDLMVRASTRYVLVAEYYNPQPVEVPYRGHAGRLFKRDFAGELMAAHPDLQLIDYGFVYHADPHFPLDDLNWFLMEKQVSR
jgi:pseudaminic acid biosynthesis-associated methylase